jgi:hypothetical protein
MAAEPMDEQARKRRYRALRKLRQAPLHVRLDAHQPECRGHECNDAVHYCPCNDGVHDDCWGYYDGCCCHNLVHDGRDWYLERDECPPWGCGHRSAQHEGIPQRLIYVMNHQDEFGVSYGKY